MRLLHKKHSLAAVLTAALVENVITCSLWSTHNSLPRHTVRAFSGFMLYAPYFQGKGKIPAKWKNVLPKPRVEFVDLLLSSSFFL